MKVKEDTRLIQTKYDPDQRKISSKVQYSTMIDIISLVSRVKIELDFATKKNPKDTALKELRRKYNSVANKLVNFIRSNYSEELYDR